LAPVVALAAIFVLIIDSGEDLEFAAEDHGEALGAHGLFDAGMAGAVAPFVEFATKGV
jgi:hypothetical protein